MERSEPSLIPEWLKGASGSALASPYPVFYQEDGGNYPRPRVSQQAAGSHTDYDSPRCAASFERSSFSSGRRSHGSSSVDQTKMDRENHSQARLNSSLVRSSSSKQGYATQIREKEREGNRTEVRDWVQDGERSVWSKEVDSLSGIGLEERQKERDRLENGRLRLIIPGKSGSHDSDAKLRRPQSMGLSPRLSENNAWKQTEGAMPTPSANLQKAAFERNFPSLGLNDKPVSSPIASPRPLWQSPLRSDLGRASSPGFMGNTGSPSMTSLSMNGAAGGTDPWNSVLVEGPSSIDHMQSISLGMSALSCSTSTPSYAVSSPATTGTVLNMAEALSHPPPRVRTPPQLTADSQRLEELALKQSRQLIPMTPSLPKTKSLSDKGKSKTVRTVDVGRSSSASRPDPSKHPQGKLLVLKANKDGVLSTTALKSEGSIVAQSSPHGLLGTSTLPILGIGGSAERTKSHGHRGQPSNGSIDSPTGVRTKDLIEDRRLIQAQNRSDFFNTLRRKAAGTGNALTNPKSESRKLDSVGVPSEAAVLEEAATSDRISGKILGGGGAGCDFHFHSYGITDSQRKGLITEEVVCIDCNSSGIDCTEEVASVDSEEEEVAFMRSLGWEENAEDSELTEEEINAFYQMRERRQLLDNEGRCGDVRMEPSDKISEVCFSSSESESDDDLRA